MQVSRSQAGESKGKPANADNTAFAGFDYIPLCGKPEQRYYFWSIKTLIKFFVYYEKSALYLCLFNILLLMRVLLPPLRQVKRLRLDAAAKQRKPPVLLPGRRAFCKSHRPYPHLLPSKAACALAKSGAFPL